MSFSFFIVSVISSDTWFWFLTVPLKALSELDIHVFVSLNWSFSFVISLQKRLVHFLLSKLDTMDKLPEQNTWSQKDDLFLLILVFYCTVVNRALLSLHGGPIDITAYLFTINQTILQLSLVFEIWSMKRLSQNSKDERRL